MKKKYKIDNVEMRLTKDMHGYTSFSFDISLEGKPVTTIIFSDVSHRKASEQMRRYVQEKCEVINDL